MASPIRRRHPRDRLRRRPAPRGAAAPARRGARRRSPGATPPAPAAFAERHGVPSAYAERRGAARGPAIDAVHICTSTPCTPRQPRDALAAGKHVLSEKPLATCRPPRPASSSRWPRRPAASAVSCRRSASTTATTRSSSTCARCCGAASYGAPHFVHGAYLQDWLLHDTDWNWRLETGGRRRSRAVADIGSHWSDLAQHLTGDVRRRGPRRPRDAASRAPPPRRGGRDVRGSAGAARPSRSRSPPRTSAPSWCGSTAARAARFVVSQTSAGQKNQLRSRSTARTRRSPGIRSGPSALWIGQRGGPNLELVRDPALLEAPARRAARCPPAIPRAGTTRCSTWPARSTRPCAPRAMAASTRRRWRRSRTAIASCSSSTRSSTATSAAPGWRSDDLWRWAHEIRSSRELVGRCRRPRRRRDEHQGPLLPDAGGHPGHARRGRGRRLRRR